MPHVNVKLYPGRSEQDKRELARAIAKGRSMTTKRWIGS